MRPPSDIPPESGFVEVGDRCWTARYEFLDVNVGLVAGSRGLLVVDTQACASEARKVAEHVRRLGRGDVVAVVNTHEHFDHAFGNAVLREEFAGAELLAHEAAALALAGTDAAGVARIAAEYGDAGHADIASTTVLAPEETFSSARSVDLGDRHVELIHPGRGHTGGDAIVRVPDADVLYAGDLVEQSALRGGVPSLGEDCYPLEWPGALDLMLSLLAESSVVVPGHGLPVDRDFVLRQRGDLAVVAETVRGLAARGVPVAEALGAADWPYPVAELGHAVRRGYEQLPRSGRALPLL